MKAKLGSSRARGVAVRFATMKAKLGSSRARGIALLVATMKAKLGSSRARGIALLVATMGLAGAPVMASPTAAASPAAETSPADPTAAQGASLATTPAEDAETAPESGSDALAVKRPPGTSVTETKAKLEASMTQIEAWAQEAREQGGSESALVSECLDATRLRGSDAMELATGELLVLADAGASEDDKALAQAKLEVAASTLDALEGTARRCRGEDMSAAQAAAENQVDEPAMIPSADPTLSGVQSPVPPPVDIHSPVTVASPSI